MPAPHVDAGAPAPVGPRLAASEIVAFALPSFGLGISFLLNALLLMKFATEVLHVAPVAIGAILLGARVWDAVSDPIVGNLSDRTRSRFGRRRPWLVASVLPIAVGIAMIWSPPAALEGSALTAWMAAATAGFRLRRARAFSATSRPALPKASSWWTTAIEVMPIEVT